MRSWVEYKEGYVVDIDKKRLLKRAKIFAAACEEYKNAYGVSAIAEYYQPYLDKALKGEIDSPQFKLPYTDAMRDRMLPENFENALMAFSWALQSKPAVYNQLDSDTLYHHREKFIKEENGKTYILEYFEDEE